MNVKHLGLAFTIATISLAGCGGGGGGSATPPAGGTTIIATATPSAGPTATPPTGGSSPKPTASPTPVASPTVAAASVSGKVLDDSGAAVSGATVYVGTNLPTGATPVPSSYGAIATTASDGTFTVSNIHSINTAYSYATMAYNATVVVVWPTSSSLPIFHAVKPLANPTGANAYGTITLDRIDSDDLGAVSTMNAYRAQNGAGMMLLDEVSVEAARMWATYVNAHPGTDHTCPNTDPTCVDAQMYEETFGLPGGGENLGASSDWTSEVTQYEGESANCSPQPAQYASCLQYAQTSNAAFESVGHWLNLVNPNIVWTGLGVAADTESGATAGTGFYDVEFLQ